MFEKSDNAVHAAQPIRDGACSDDDIWLAGLGALIITELENNRLFDSLVREGQAIDLSLNSASENGAQAALDLAERTPQATERLLRIARYRHLMTV